MTVVIALAWAVAAFVFVRPAQLRARPHPRTTLCWRPWKLGLLTFAAGSSFHVVTQWGHEGLTPWVAALIALAIPSAMLGLVLAMCRSIERSQAHVDALMLGALTAYCWMGFFLVRRLHGGEALPGQVFPCAVVLLLVCGRFLWRRQRGPE